MITKVATVIFFLAYGLNYFFPSQIFAVTAAIAAIVAAIALLAS